MKQISFDKVTYTHLSFVYIIDYLCVSLLKLELNFMVEKALKCGFRLGSKIVKLNNKINSILYRMEQFEVAINYKQCA